MQIAACPLDHRTTNDIRNQTDEQVYADLRTALSTSVLPSDQIAPGTL
jgi:hypothetical protein